MEVNGTPQGKPRIVIEATPQGISVSGPLQDWRLCMNLLGAAMSVVANQKPEGTLVVPAKPGVMLPGPGSRLPPG